MPPTNIPWPDYRDLRPLPEKADEQTEARGFQLFQRGTDQAFERTDAYQFRVRSSTGRGWYIVDCTLDEGRPVWRCECADYITRLRTSGMADRVSSCKHMCATRHYILRGSLDSWNEAENKPKKRYKNPPGYRESRKAEGDLVRELLHGLCIELEPPAPSPKGGRPPDPLSDVVFACVMRSYNAQAADTSMSAFNDAAMHGYMTKVIEPHTITRFLKDRRPGHEGENAKILDSLIARTARTASSPGTVWAVDSTNLTTQKVGRSTSRKRSDKHAKLRRTLRVHILYDTKTHMFGSIRITGTRDEDADDEALVENIFGDKYPCSDSKNFEPVVRAGLEAGLNIGEIVADNAYAMRTCFDAAQDMGVLLRPMFYDRKYDTRHRDKNAMGERMWEEFHADNASYKKAYHKRSNAEAANSAIKRKISRTVFSRIIPTMENEVRCWAIAYNLTKLVEEIYVNKLHVDWVPEDARGLPA